MSTVSSSASASCGTFGGMCSTSPAPSVDHLLAVLAELEAQPPFENPRDLLVLVRVLRHDGVLREIDLREHRLLARDEAPADERVELLARHVVPAVLRSTISHDPESMDRWATFDCYGTLIDWNGGIRRELERLFGEERARP